MSMFNCPSAEEAIQQRHCNFVIRHANTDYLLCSILSLYCHVPVLFTVRFRYLIILLFNLDVSLLSVHSTIFLVNKVVCE